MCLFVLYKIIGTDQNRRAYTGKMSKFIQDPLPGSRKQGRELLREDVGVTFRPIIKLLNIYRRVRDVSRGTIKVVCPEDIYYISQ